MGAIMVGYHYQIVTWYCYNDIINCNQLPEYDSAALQQWWAAVVQHCSNGGATVVQHFSIGGATVVQHFSIGGVAVV